MIRNPSRAFLVCALAGLTAVSVSGQEASEGGQAASIEVSPPELVLQVGESVQLTTTVKDEAGNPVAAPVIYFSRSRRNVGVDSKGVVEAYRPGEYVIVARIPAGDEDVGSREAEGLSVEIPVTIPTPPVERLVFVDIPDRVYTGTTVRVKAEVYDASQALRHDIRVEFGSDNRDVAAVDRFGNLTGGQLGTATVFATAEAVREQTVVRVVPNPVRSLELTASRAGARTGDVIHFEAVARDQKGEDGRGRSRALRGSSACGSLGSRIRSQGPDR